LKIKGLRVLISP